MKLFYSIICCFLLIAATSCNDDEGYDYRSWDKVFAFDYPDTTLTASPHTFSLVIHAVSTIPVPDDWGIISVSEWNNEGDEDNYDYQEGDWWYLYPTDSPLWEVEPSNTFDGYDWIHLTTGNADGQTVLNVEVAQNDTGKERAIRLYVGVDDYKGKLVAELIIIQKPAPDQTPFTYTARYKNVMRSSSAHLDMDEKIVFDDPDFAAWIADIESKDGIRIIIMDDEVVDYYDDEDEASNPAVKSITEVVDASRPFALRHDLVNIPTRANGAWNDMEDNALGYFAMFDDDNYSDTHTSTNLYEFDKTRDCNNMRDIGLNDKVTSLVVAYNGTDEKVCSVLTIWEDSHYNFGDNDRTKHRISFVASYERPRVMRDNLKNIKCIGSGDSWNDRISSFSFYFGNYARKLKDY